MNDETDGDPSLQQTMSVADIAEPPVTMDRLARIYVKMRDKIAELESQQEQVKDQQKQVAAAMKDMLMQAGGESIRTAHGTVTLKTSKRYYTQDWEEMHKFILEHSVPQLLEKRIAQTNMADFLEANPSLVPPGLNTMSEQTVSVTKPRK